MEEIGKKLQTTREAKGYSIDQVARDTNIAKRYIRALEGEDFTEFPGEPYLIGFLRNYSDYLGLNPDDIIALYKNFKIQEQPVPIEELIIKKGASPVLKIIAGIIIAAALVVGGYFLAPLIVSSINTIKENAAEKAGEVSAAETGTVYTLTDEFIESRFIKGDEIRIPVDDSIRSILILSVSDQLGLKTPEAEITLKLGEERSLDLDGDSGSDIRIIVRDIDAKESAAVLRFDKLIQAPVSSGGSDNTEAQSNDSSESGEVVVTTVTGTQSGGSRVREILTVDEAGSIRPFSVDIVFDGYCFFRYSVDGSEREEKFFHKNERFKQDVNEEIRLWVSNAASLSTTVAGKRIELGNPGEVAAKIISWIKDNETGLYQLKIVPVY